jgi:hypothetical protein
MGKMQEEIKALRRQNTHLQNVVQRQRERLSEADEAMKAFSDMVDAHYAACAVQFGEKREDCDTLWGYHLEIPAKLVTQALTDYTVQVALDKERGVYVIGAMKKE